VSVLSKQQLLALKAFSDEGIEFDSSNDLLDHLEALESPAQLFYLPFVLNWDDSHSVRVISWILNSPLCDVGTALVIYWLMAPTDWVGREVDPSGDAWENEQIALLRKIEASVLSCAYPSAEISFDPTSLRRFWNADGSERRDLSGIPPHMKRPTPGASLPSARDLGL
jgi:hypothetical protein